MGNCLKGKEVKQEEIDYMAQMDIDDNSYMSSESIIKERQWNEMKNKQLLPKEYKNKDNVMTFERNNNKVFMTESTYFALNDD